MNQNKLLEKKHVLIVDDEQDIRDFVEEELDTCLVNKAKDYNEALQYLQNYTYDVVILDIMGVNGFELLKKSVSEGFPTVMLTAHALSPESLKKSIKLGAVSFLPKDKMTELRVFIEDVVRSGGKPVWQKLFGRIGSHFDRRFGSDWKERDAFFKELEEAINLGIEHWFSSQIEKFIKVYHRSEVIFEENTLGNEMYIICSGKVRVSEQNDEREITLDTLGPGEFFGEMALVDSSSRSAKATAIEENTRLAVLDQKRFLFLVSQQPVFALTIMHVLCKRLRDFSKRYSNSIK